MSPLWGLIPNHEIYTSHYMEEVEELCTRVTILYHGRVIASGSKEELKSFISDEECVVIELMTPKQKLCLEIEKLGGVKYCEMEENVLRVVSEKNAGNLSKIIDAILQRSSEIKPSIYKPLPWKGCSLP